MSDYPVGSSTKIYGFVASFYPPQPSSKRIDIEFFAMRPSSTHNMTLPKTLRVTVAIAAAHALAFSAGAKLDFNKDVKPVLEQNCVGCHNAQHAEENGNYRMDNKVAAFKPHGDKQRISPGHPTASQVYTLTQRPVTDDKVMPPKERPRPTQQELDTIKTWIAEGADWPEGVTLKTQINFVAGIKPILEKGGPFSKTELRDLKTWLSEGAYWPAGVKFEGAKPMPKSPAGATDRFRSQHLANSFQRRPAHCRRRCHPAPLGRPRRKMATGQKES